MQNRPALSHDRHPALQFTPAGFLACEPARPTNTNAGIMAGARMRHLLSILCILFCTTGAIATELSVEPGDIYPAGDTLLFSMYTLQKPQLQSAAADGLTSIGPYYGSREGGKLFKRVETSGLPVVYTLGPKVEWDDKGFDGFDDAFTEFVAELKEVARNPTVSVWNLRTEELRHWKPVEMRWLEAITQAIRAEDPLNRPIMMYEPNHRPADGMVKTGAYLDFVARGAYANHVGMKDKRTWVRWSVEQSVTAARELGNTPVAVLWMAKDQQPDDVGKIAAWTRHDVYLSLVMGAKGILVWSANNRREGFSKHFKNFYTGYTTVARELNGEPGLGPVFLSGSRKDDLQLEVADGPDSQSFNYRKETMRFPSVSHARLDHDGRHYLFIVNSVDETVTVTLKGNTPAADANDAFSGGEATVESSLELPPYAVRGFVWDK